MANKNYRTNKYIIFRVFLFNYKQFVADFLCKTELFWLGQVQIIICKWMIVFFICLYSNYEHYFKVLWSEIKLLFSIIWKKW